MPDAAVAPAVRGGLAPHPRGAVTARLYAPSRHTRCARGGGVLAGLRERRACGSSARGATRRTTGTGRCAAYGSPPSARRTSEPGGSRRPSRPGLPVPGDSLERRVDHPDVGLPVGGKVGVAVDGEGSEAVRERVAAGFLACASLRQRRCLSSHRWRARRPRRLAYAPGAICRAGLPLRSSSGASATTAQDARSLLRRWRSCPAGGGAPPDRARRCRFGSVRRRRA
jgi:hypothetical protein